MEAMPAECCVRGAKAEAKRLSVSKPGTTASKDDIDRWFKEQTLSALYTADLEWIKGHLLPASKKPMSYAIDIVKKQGLPEETDINKLTVGTIHSVKGGEADTVIIFPDLSLLGREAYYRKGGEELMAVRRQFYVGMTRARDTLACMDARAFTEMLA